MIISLVFKKNADFFRRKLGKIAENCDHNIDPWVARFFLVRFSFKNCFDNAEISF
jgi:hypothetical protein